MAVPCSGTSVCPLFRPAIILSVLPLESRGSRTFRSWPSDPGLTDKLPTTSQADELAAWSMRKIAFKNLRQIIIKMTREPTPLPLNLPHDNVLYHGEESW